MTATTTYFVIYTWKGEWHRLSVDFKTEGEARQKAEEMRQQKWQAWIEDNCGNRL